MRRLMLAAGLAMTVWWPFKATAAPDPPVAVLLAAGDIAYCKAASANDEATAEIIRREVAAAEKMRVPIRILALGDLAYPDGTPEQFKCFDRSWGEFKPLILPVPGNHDQNRQGGKPFYDYFKSAPWVSQNGRSKGFYSLDLANWHLVALNAYAGIGPGSEQLKWLDADLKRTPAKCILAFSHPFVFSSGHHGHARSNSKQAPVKSLDILKPAYRMLHAAGTAVILMGHDHDFEQFAPQTADGVAQATAPRSFVVGTGGAPLYNRVAYDHRAPNSEAYAQTSHGLLKLTLYPGSFDWDFLPITAHKDVVLEPSSDRCRER